jgi:hypothetical protein
MQQFSDALHGEELDIEITKKDITLIRVKGGLESYLLLELSKFG